MVQTTAGGAEPVGAANLRWLLSRIDRQCLEAVDALLVGIVETIAVATGDASGVRMLSADGVTMIPVCSYHPDPDAARSIERLRSQTLGVAGGVWAAVLEHRETQRWQIEELRATDPSASMASFVDSYQLRAALALPLLDDGRVVGGLGLCRLGAGREYTERDQALAEECAARLGPVMGLRRLVSGIES